MTDLQRRLLVILVVELIQTAVSGWCWWMTRGRWLRATDEHSQYVEGDATHPPMNDAGAEILRVRVERYAGWMGIHLWYFAGGLFASVGRVIALLSMEAPTALITASRDVQILVGSVLMFRMMSKDDFSRKRVSRMDDAEALRHLTVQAAAGLMVQEQQAIRSSVNDVSVKLDALQNQQIETASHLAETTTEEASAVRARLEAATAHGGSRRDMIEQAAEAVAKHTAVAMDAQTHTLTDTIEAAKEYTADKAHEAFKEANEVNRKIAELQIINEAHGEMLNQLLKVIQKSQKEEAR